MIYSVWNQALRSYDYYETGERANATHAGAPPRPLLASSLGAAPEQAAWPLPMGAKRVGAGPVARGRIAKRPSFGGLGELSLPADPMPWILIGVGAYLWWRHR